MSYTTTRLGRKTAAALTALAFALGLVFPAQFNLSPVATAFAKQAKDEDDEEEGEEEEEEEAPKVKKVESKNEQKAEKNTSDKKASKLDVKGEIAAAVIPSSVETKKIALEVEVSMREWLAKNNVKSADILTALGGRHKLDSAKLKSDAEKLISEAQTFYDNSDYDGAIKKLKEAEKNLRPILNVKGASEALIRAMTLRGACQILNMDNEEGAATLAQIFTINAEATAPDWFPEIVANIFKNVRAKSQSIKSGALSIKTSPDGVRIYIDGVYRGISPLSLDNVAPGDHTVFAEATGFLEAMETVEVKGEEKSSLTLALSPATNYPTFKSAIDSAQSDFSNPNLHTAAKTLARLLDVRSVLFLHVSKTQKDHKLKAMFYDLDENKFKTRSTSLPDGISIPDEIDALFGMLFTKETEWASVKPQPKSKDGVVAAGKEKGEELDLDAEPQQDEKDDSGAKPFYATWWFWTIVGGGAALLAGGGVGTYFLVKGSGGGGSSSSGGQVLIKF